MTPGLEETPGGTPLREQLALWSGAASCRVDNALALRELGDFLRGLSYATSTVISSLDLPYSVAAVLSDSGRFSLFYAEDLELVATANSVLARLFLAMCGVPLREAAGCLPRELMVLLRRLGLVRVDAADPACLWGVVSIVEYQGRYFLSDPLFQNRRSSFSVLDRDASRCMPPHASSFELLSRLRPLDDGESFLDVGCGCGCQSLLVGAAYPRITAIDVEVRAAGFCRANAVLNACPVNVEQARCEAFAPGGRFDHVVFNSPSGRAVVLPFIRKCLPTLLSNRGVAQVRANLAVRADDRGLERVLDDALRGSGLVYDLARVDGSPFSITPEAIENRELPPKTLLVDTPEHGRAYVDELRRHGVVEVVTFVLDLRRR